LGIYSILYNTSLYGMYCAIKISNIVLLYILLRSRQSKIKKPNMNLPSTSINGLNLSIILCIYLLLISNSYQCQLVKNVPHTINSKDTTILVHDTFLVSIPKTYTINSGIGDDTEFMQIINTSGSIFINYETGVELINKNDNINNVKLIRDNYKEVKRIKTLKNITIWLAYNSTENKFRNIKGIVFIENANSIDEILKFDCNSKNLEEVIRIISSLRSIY
jgi:hypothetical protein